MSLCSDRAQQHQKRCYQGCIIRAPRKSMTFTKSEKASQWRQHFRQSLKGGQMSNSGEGEEGSGKMSSHTGREFSSGAQACLTLCDPMDHSTPGLPVHHHSQSSLRLRSIELVMPSSHLILGRPLLLLPPIPASESFPVSQLYS